MLECELSSWKSCILRPQACRLTRGTAVRFTEKQRTTVCYSVDKVHGHGDGACFVIGPDSWMPRYQHAIACRQAELRPSTHEAAACEKAENCWYKGIERNFNAWNPGKEMEQITAQVHEYKRPLMKLSQSATMSTTTWRLKCSVPPQWVTVSVETVERHLWLWLMSASTKKHEKIGQRPLWENSVQLRKIW